MAIVVLICLGFELPNSYDDEISYDQTFRRISSAFTIIITLMLAVPNALGYYLWDVVNSAYKKIKEENSNINKVPKYQKEVIKEVYKKYQL